MNVFVFYNGNYPQGGGMAKRLHLYCKGLLERDVKVNIFIPNPTNKRNGKNVLDALCGSFEGVNFNYLSKTKTRSSNFFKRTIIDLIGYLRLCFLIYKNRNSIDILFIVDIRSYFNIIYILMSKFYQFKVLYELNEHPLILIRPLDYWLQRKLIYPLFDGFIVISKPLYDLVQTFNKKKDNALLLPIITEKKEINFRGLSKVSETPFILHSGSLSENKDGILGIIDAFSIAVNKYNLDIKLYFTGKLSFSYEHSLIHKKIASLGLHKNIIFLGYLDERELVYYQSLCKTVIINKAENFQNKYCFPTKLGEYLTFEKPVILTDIEIFKDYFIDEFNAFIVKPNDPEMIASRINDIFISPEKANYIGLNGSILVDNIFNYSIQSVNLLNYFVRLRN